jgi:hypothetical protein
MTVEAEKPTEEAVRHICTRLRAADAAEINGLRWDDDVEGLVAAVMARPLGMTEVFTWNDEPVAILGTVPYWPGVWEVFAFGTDKWHKAAKSLTQRACQYITPAIYHAGGHRAQCWSAADHTDAHKWLTRTMRARHEGVARGLGRDGEDYHLYAWNRAEMEAIMEAHNVLWR